MAKGVPQSRETSRAEKVQEVPPIGKAPQAKATRFMWIKQTLARTMNSGRETSPSARQIWRGDSPLSESADGNAPLRIGLCIFSQQTRHLDGMQSLSVMETEVHRGKASALSSGYP